MKNKINIERIGGVKLIVIVCFILSACSTGPKIIETSTKCSDLPLTIEWRSPEQKPDKDGILREIKGYRVYIKSPSSQYFQEFVDAGLVNHYAYKQLEPGKHYDFQVSAYNEVGVGSPSAVIRKQVCQTAIVPSIMSNVTTEVKTSDKDKRSKVKRKTK